MKNTQRGKQKWFSALVLTSLLLLASRSGQGSGLRAIPSGSLAPSVKNSEVVKISADKLTDPVLKQFKEDLHTLFNEQGSPFECLLLAQKSQDAGPNHPGQSLTTAVDMPSLEQAIIDLFVSNEDGMEKGDFTGFDQALGQLLNRPDYPCFQDAFYYNPAYAHLKDLSRKAVPPFYLGLAPASDPNNTTTGTPPSGLSTPPTTGSSTPTTPAFPPVSTASTTGSATGVSSNDSSIPSATIIQDPEQSATSFSAMSSGGACSLTLLQPAQGFSWNTFGYLLMLFPVGLILAIKAKAQFIHPLLGERAGVRGACTRVKKSEEP